MIGIACQSLSMTCGSESLLQLQRNIDPLRDAIYSHYFGQKISPLPYLSMILRHQKLLSCCQDSKTWFENSCLLLIMTKIISNHKFYSLSSWHNISSFCCFRNETFPCCRRILSSSSPSSSVVLIIISGLRNTLAQERKNINVTIDVVFSVFLTLSFLCWSLELTKKRWKEIDMKADMRWEATTRKKQHKRHIMKRGGKKKRIFVLRQTRGLKKTTQSKPLWQVNLIQTRMSSNEIERELT